MYTLMSDPHISQYVTFFISYTHKLNILTEFNLILIIAKNT